ncbi:hypothetical protein P4H70_12765 [Paenibacillus ehimensis]|uniref:hypothetical protein n=1 Tax=Paenibacillus ehimensis TaxID=79264 RepID=UPI002DBC02AB|nr:hypothetical protein [Paenibacillus ehimensis]MEC0209803.1 hypothetical protein [Paenibacillus ehimensis]
MLKLSDPLPEVNGAILSTSRIGLIEVYRFDCRLIEARITGNCRDCYCGLLKLSSHGVNGWAEYIVPDTKPYADIVRWTSVFLKLKGLSVSDAVSYVRSHAEAWGPVRTDIAEAALADLTAQLLNPAAGHDHEGAAFERSRLIDCSQAYCSF